jgi:hypothetical protein
MHLTDDAGELKYHMVEQHRVCPPQSWTGRTRLALEKSIGNTHTTAASCQHVGFHWATKDYQDPPAATGVRLHWNDSERNELLLLFIDLNAY